MINNSDLHFIFKWNAIHFHLRKFYLIYTYNIYSLLNYINKKTAFTNYYIIPNQYDFHMQIFSKMFMLLFFVFFQCILKTSCLHSKNSMVSMVVWHFLNMKSFAFSHWGFCFLPSDGFLHSCGL